VDALAGHPVPLGDLRDDPLSVQDFLFPCVLPLFHDPHLHQHCPDLLSRGHEAQESSLGGGVKHLMKLSKIRWNSVKDQPEPIRKASPGIAHTVSPDA
jgi:hypothetical protein